MEARAVAIQGAPKRTFEVEVRDGSLVEKVVDYSTGELTIGVSRNGELSDAVFSVRVPEIGKEVATGRTYTSPDSNPKTVRIVSGTYEVSVSSVELANRPSADLGSVTIEPRGTAEVSHDFKSGTLEVGASRDGVLVDATLHVKSLATGKPVGQGRTYTKASSNPKTFLLEPGEYAVTVKEVGGERAEIRVTVRQGEVVERMVDPATPSEP